ncbi:hypothetical protein [Acidaminococcus fermentans]
MDTNEYLHEKEYTGEKIKNPENQGNQVKNILKTNRMSGSAH